MAPSPIVRTPFRLGRAHALGRVGWVSDTPYQHGRPTKAVIEANRSSTVTRVVLTGMRCSDGQQLRFWFGDRRRSSVRVPLAELRRRNVVMTGYLLFTSPGRWRVTARSGAHTLGSVVFSVHG